MLVHYAALGSAIEGRERAERAEGPEARNGRRSAEGARSRRVERSAYTRLSHKHLTSPFIVSAQFATVIYSRTRVRI